MESLEQLHADLQSSGINVDLLSGYDRDNVYRFGVRLRTFGKNTPKDLMVLSVGETFTDAVNNAVAKAQAGRWEKIDWAARPWDVRTAYSSASPYGLGKPL